MNVSSSPLFSAPSYYTDDSRKKLDSLRQDANAIEETKPTHTNVFTSEDMAKKYERVDKLLSQIEGSRSLFKKELESVLKRMGVSTRVANEMKVEIGADGGIVVGGLQDTVLAKQIQSQLRDTRGLLSILSGCQKAERELAVELGGSVWKDIRNVSRGNPSGEGPDMQKIIEDSPFLQQATDVAQRVAAVFSPDGADFTHDKKGVANPAGALKNLMSEAKSRINSLFNKHNMKAASLSGPDDEKDDNGPAAAALMSLDNVQITMTSDGAIRIKGAFSRDEATNAVAESLVRSVLTDLMGADGSGKENTLSTAARQLLVKHEEEHGFVIEDKTVTMEISGNGVGAYLNSEGAEGTLTAAIRKEALRYFRDKAEDPDAFVNLDALKVSASGTLYLDMKDDAEADPIAQALVGELNHIITTGPELFQGTKQVAGLFISSKIAEILSYGAAGNQEYSDNEAMDRREQLLQGEAEAAVRREWGRQFDVSA